MFKYHSDIAIVSHSTYSSGLFFSLLFSIGKNIHGITKRVKFNDASVHFSVSMNGFPFYSMISHLI